MSGHANTLCFSMTKVLFVDAQIAEQKLEKMKKFHLISFAFATSVEAFPRVEVGKGTKYRKFVIQLVLVSGPILTT